MTKYNEQLKEITDAIRAKDPSERTYEDRWYLWLEKTRNAPLDAPYDVGEEIEIYDGQKLASNQIKSGMGPDYPEWFREIGNHFGEKCRMPDGKVYTLKGVSETFEDLYYIVESEDGKRSHHTCVGKIEFV